MADILQTQKSFAYGQTGLTGFSNITENYDHSCKKLKNVIVNKNGSIRVRGGWTDIGVSFNLPAKTKVRDVFKVEGNYLFWLEGDGELKNEGLWIYDKDTVSDNLPEGRKDRYDKLERMKFDFRGSYIYADKFKVTSNNFQAFSEDEQFNGHGFDYKTINTKDIENVLPFENFLYVFFKDSFPYIVKAEMGVIVTAPYFQGVGAGRIWKAFPFNYTAKRKTLGSYYYRSGPDLEAGIPEKEGFYPALNQEENLRLMIRNVNISGRECEAWLEPDTDNPKNENLPRDLFIDTHYYSLKKFIGKPIAFRVGPKDLKVLRYLEEPAEQEGSIEGYLNNYYGRSDFLESKSRLIQSQDKSFILPADVIFVNKFTSGWRADVAPLRFSYSRRVFSSKRAAEIYIDTELRDRFVRNLRGSADYNTSNNNIYETRRQYGTLGKSHYRDYDVIIGREGGASFSFSGASQFRAGAGIALPRALEYEYLYDNNGRKGAREAIREAQDDFESDAKRRLQDWNANYNRIVGRVVDSMLGAIKRRVKENDEPQTASQAEKAFSEFKRNLPSGLKLTLRRNVVNAGQSSRLQIAITDKSRADILELRQRLRSETGLNDDRLKSLVYFYWNDKEIEVNPVKENGEIDRNTKVYLTLKSSLDFVKFLVGVADSGRVFIQTHRRGYVPGEDNLDDYFEVTVNEKGDLSENPLLGISPDDTAQQILVKEAYNFYVIFPYQAVEVPENDRRYQPMGLTSNPRRYYCKCKIYEIGSKLSSESLLGNNLNEELYRKSTDYIITDWADGWPKSGDVLNDKFFFFTSGSKLSFSRTDKPYIWGNPIKSLINVPNYNLRYQETANRPSDVDDDDGNSGDSVRFQALLREDFKYPTIAIDEFFDAIEAGNDAKQYTVADPLTYRIEDKNGLLVDVRRHFIVSAGVLTAVGIQCIFFTDKGTFYWGLAPGDADFLKIANVSNFIGGEDSEGHDFGIAEILNKVFATSQDGELHKSDYDPNNRNFIAQPAGVDRGFKGFVHGENFIGNRLLFIDRFSNKMYCCNVGMRGELMGVSEWEVPGWTPRGLWKFRDDYMSAFQKDQKVTLLRYKDDNRFDENKSFDVSEFLVSQAPDKREVIGEVETAPLTWKAKYASDPCLHMTKRINRVFFYTDWHVTVPTPGNTGLSPGEIQVEVTNMVNGVLLSQNLKDMKNKGQDGIFSYTKPFSVPEGRGFRFRFLPNITISGVVMYLNAST